MGEAARAAGVRVVAGDTKVVERARGDGCHVVTAGVGVLREGVALGPDRARPGDAVILSGTVGDHGVAVMSVREGLEFETTIESDTAPLEEVETAVRLNLPFEARATRLELWRQDAAGRWHPHWRFPLGGDP